MAPKSGGASQEAPAQPVQEKPGRTSATHRTDPAPALVDTSSDFSLPDGAVTGATHRTEPEPALVDNSGIPLPLKAGELRAKGYAVDSRFDDDEVPGEYSSATHRTDPEPAHVQDFSPPNDGLTLLERSERAAKGEGTTDASAEAASAGPAIPVTGPEPASTTGLVSELPTAEPAAESQPEPATEPVSEPQPFVGLPPDVVAPPPDSTEVPA